MITCETDLYCIVGDPVSHSKSPFMHNTYFSDLKKNAVYLAFNVKNENLTQVITGFKCLKELKGINITVPHKRNIIPFLDSIDPVAEKIGSVNTVKNENGLWKGFNTDWFGVYMTMKNHAIPKDLDILIIGAGGASSAVIYGMQEWGCKSITITNRTESTAEELAGHFNIKSINFAEYKKKCTDFDLIINTTTLPFGNLIDSFDKKTIYYDLKYYINEKMENIRYIDGKDMLVYQGVKSFEIWTGILPDPSEIRKTLAVLQ